ncbi:MAG: tetratricopeptide repeat protein [Thermohalobaculum sp.]|nr:tetratricopeptide repeat protein [Thermohalobaculum sp.]
MTSHPTTPLVAASAAAPASWDRTVAAFLAHSAETPVHLGATLNARPDFAMGWIAKGFFYLLLGRAELVAVAREALAAAEAAVAAAGADARERLYLDALRAYVAGRPSAACARLAEVLVRHPSDTLAFKLDHAIRFVLGDRRGMLEASARMLPAIGRDHPHLGYVLGCRAFALEENGAYADAELTGRRAVDLAPDDAWGLHAVAHVYDMTARVETGIRWLETRTSAWAHCNNFGTHVWWHLALFYLERGEHDRVFDLYDTRVRAEHTDDYRDIANGASMLMRLELEGLEVGDRWEELADLAANRVEPGCVVFADLHYLLALGAAGRTTDADRLIERLARDAQAREHDMHEVAAVAGHPTALGLAAFRAGDYGRAFDLLRQVRPALQSVGGSHAQRDVFSRLMIEAGIRAGRYVEAEAELAARAARRGAEDGFTARRRTAIARAQRARGVAAE